MVFHCVVHFELYHDNICIYPLVLQDLATLSRMDKTEDILCLPEDTGISRTVHVDVLTTPE